MILKNTKNKCQKKNGRRPAEIIRLNLKENPTVVQQVCEPKRPHPPQGVLFQPLYPKDHRSVDPTKRKRRGLDREVPIVDEYFFVHHGCQYQERIHVPCL